MGFDIASEVNRAQFLDWIENNKDKVMSFLILEHEDLLIDIFNNPEWIE